MTADFSIDDGPLKPDEVYTVRNGQIVKTKTLAARIAAYEAEHQAEHLKRLEDWEKKNPTRGEAISLFHLLLVAALLIFVGQAVQICDLSADISSSQATNSNFSQADDDEEFALSILLTNNALNF